MLIRYLFLLLLLLGMLGCISPTVQMPQDTVNNDSPQKSTIAALESKILQLDQSQNKSVSEKEIPTPIIIERIIEREIEKEIIVTATPYPTQFIPKYLTPESYVPLVPTPSFIGSKKTREIVFAGLDWTSVAVQNGVASYIVEHGYGYPVSFMHGSTVPLFQGLIKGDVDINMEVWLPNQNEAWDKGTKNGQVIGVGKSLADNWQSTFVVHKHTIDMYPGLRRATDLLDYYSLFQQPDSGGKGVLVGCIAGWACRGVNEAQIEVLGLSDVIELRDPGSQAGLFASISAAGDKGTHWLGYMWGPTEPDAKYDLVQLEQDPAEDCGGEPKLGCAFGLAEILIGVNKSMIAEAPEVVEFLTKYNWPAEYQLPAEAWYHENKDKTEYKDDPGVAVAEWWLCNESEWYNWVTYEAAMNIQSSLDCY